MTTSAPSSFGRDWRPEAYDLPPSVLQQTFNERIRPLLTGVAREAPTVVFLAGQPGAGKTTAEQLVLDQLGLPHAVHLDADEYFAFHDRFAELSALDDRTASLKVDSASVAWAAMAQAHIRNNRFDAVITQPLFNPDQTEVLLRQFRDAGYHIELVVMATHEAQSQLDILHRYQRMRDGAWKGPPKWIGPRQHTRASRGVLRTVDRVQRLGLVDGLHVARRNVGIVYTNQRDAHGWQLGVRTSAVIRLLRSLPWTGVETAEFRRRGQWVAHSWATDHMPRELHGVLRTTMRRGEAHIRRPGPHQAAAAASAAREVTSRALRGVTGLPTRRHTAGRSRRGAAAAVRGRGGQRSRSGRRRRPSDRSR